MFRQIINQNLILASNKGFLDIVQLLLDNGANVNDSNFDQQTALMEASEEGHFEVVKLLVQKGANVNLTDRRGRTAAQLTTSPLIRDFLTRSQTI